MEIQFNSALILFLLDEMKLNVCVCVHFSVYIWSIFVLPKDWSLSVFFVIQLLKIWIPDVSLLLIDETWITILFHFLHNNIYGGFLQSLIFAAMCFALVDLAAIGGIVLYLNKSAYVEPNSDSVLFGHSAIHDCVQFLVCLGPVRLCKFK